VKKIPIPPARFCGFSTEAGSAIIAPAGKPQISPNAISTASG
jgi:hypothetical protein